MKSYIETLRAEVNKAARQREVETVKNRHPDPRVLPHWKPLDEQVDIWWASLPKPLQNRNYALNEICAQLAGKYTARPHSAAVAQVLLSKGWKKKRDWSDGQGRRLWHPNVS